MPELMPAGYGVVPSALSETIRGQVLILLIALSCLG